jgi:glycerol-3-phosphate dehydrogenase
MTRPSTWRRNDRGRASTRYSILYREQNERDYGQEAIEILQFPDYSLDELVAIGELMLGAQRYRLSPEACSVFRDYLARRMSRPRFANARSVRNALERARLRQANRLVAAAGTLAKDDLMRLEPPDFLASRVFAT